MPLYISHDVPISANDAGDLSDYKPLLERAATHAVETGDCTDLMALATRVQAIAQGSRGMSDAERMPAVDLFVRAALAINKVPNVDARAMWRRLDHMAPEGSNAKRIARHYLAMPAR